MTLSFAPDVPLALVLDGLKARGLMIQGRTSPGGTHQIDWRPNARPAPANVPADPPRVR